MIRKLKSIFLEKFIYNKDLHERTVRIVLALAFAASAIGMGRVMIGANPIVLAALIPMFVLSGAAFLVAAKYQRPRAASWLLILSSNVILLPLVFVFSSGTDSGTQIWFVLGFIYVFLLFRGREFWSAFILSAVADFTAYMVTYLFPEVVPQAPSRFYGFADSGITLLCISCFIGLLLKLQSASYEREKALAEQQREEIEQIARSKDAFFANMSHEIRTPINTIIGLNEMTLREDISDEIAENAINIQNASKMLLTTINDILDLSKLESGKLDIVPTQYEVSSMFSDLVNLVWVRANQKELEFKVDIDKEIPSMLYGDEVRIKQIITNLITNAVKYTETGSVTLTAKGEHTAPDEILLRISVEDTGKGIRRESLAELFNSFKRVDEKENRYIEGTGLGLNISKQLAEMMGGKITVDSVYHKGSVFTLELQQRIVNARPIGVIDFAAQRRLSQREKYRQVFMALNAKVLVVDDNSMNRMVAVKLLRDTKVIVDTAASGKECLKKTADLSGAYPNATQASKSFDNVTVVDSNHISSGHGLMVLYAAALAEEGRSVDEICRRLAVFRENVFSNFLVPSTATLARNGKVSGLVNKVCSTLNLHPVLSMSRNQLKLWKIEVGNMDRVNRRYVKKLFKHRKQIDTRILFLTYAGCTVSQVDAILEEVKKYISFDRIVLQKASATVSSNCGIGTFGLMFIRHLRTVPRRIQ